MSRGRKKERNEVALEPVPTWPGVHEGGCHVLDQCRDVVLLQVRRGACVVLLHGCARAVATRRRNSHVGNSARVTRAAGWCMLAVRILRASYPVSSLPRYCGCCGLRSLVSALCSPYVSAHCTQHVVACDPGQAHTLKPHRHPAALPPCTGKLVV